MRTKIINTLVTVILSFALSIMPFGLIIAQDGDSGDAAEITSGTCPEEVIEELREYKVEFYTTLENKLESTSLNSELLHNVYTDFYNYQQEVRDISATNTIEVEGTEETVGAYLACREIIEGELSEVQAIFIQYVTEMAARKRNFILLEKYDGINEGLELLQEELHNIRSDIEYFNDNLPCFIDTCVQK